VLVDVDVSPNSAERVAGERAGLLARLLQVNAPRSAGCRRRGTEGLPAAINRVSICLIRASAVAGTLSQLASSAATMDVRRRLHAIWQRSAHVAACAGVVTRDLTNESADTAVLAGTLHAIGRIYLLLRAADYPALLAEQKSYARLERLWHAEIAKDLCAAWGLPEKVANAIHLHEDLEDIQSTDGKLRDVLSLASRLATQRRSLLNIEWALQGVTAAGRMTLNPTSLSRVLAQSASDIDRLRLALGQQVMTTAS
jgi:HD-like signal output (HDOD) protein